MVKDAIIADINARTDEKIVGGLVWTPQAGGDPIPVWLSTENQFNFKSAYDLAVQKQGATLPVTFKMGEDEEGNPVYHTFETMEDADDFYLECLWPTSTTCLRCRLVGKRTLSTGHHTRSISPRTTIIRKNKYKILLNIFKSSARLRQVGGFFS